jgi:hypothetical protein
MCLFAEAISLLYEGIALFCEKNAPQTPLAMTIISFLVFRVDSSINKIYKRNPE